MTTEHNELTSLPIAVRVYPQPQIPDAEARPTRSRNPWRAAEALFVLDAETRADAMQALIFGSYRFILSGRCLEEGLFHADDITEQELQALKDYVATHVAETVDEGPRQLQLLTRSQFVERLYRAVYKGRCLLVGFNLPFDLSRVAFDFANARGRFAGGFALELWSYLDQAGVIRQHPYRPRIAIKHIDSKRALKGFTSRRDQDRVDRIPEHSETGQPELNYNFRGHFLDLRTLAFALTDRGYSLDTACEAFGVEHPKQSVKQHGIVTPEYIDYNRRDVLATAELAVKLLEEYEKHPIVLQPTKAYSPASIGKGYLRAMGITPILERQPDFPKEYLGYAQAAFFGGRTSAHVRKIPVPTILVDFLSMYPTVNSLMGLWRFVTAREIRVVDHCQKDICRFLRSISRDRLFQPETWKQLTAFVKIIPDGDILPSRSKYSDHSNDWQVAVNYISGDKNNPKHALWFSLPDVVTSVILTGRIPNIVDAFRIEPVGVLPGLKPIKLRGVIQVDPAQQDFFKVVIEERKRLGSRPIPESEKKRLDKALKVLANAASYGIYAEMNRMESDEEVDITCRGIDSKPYQCRVAHPEAPGEYCFPPLASLITGGARLMLGLLEHSVSDLGGTYSMEDTDSMGIVATEHGGVIPCPGGNRRTDDGQAGIKALSWKQVNQIVTKFERLNPYDRDAVPGSILKVEADNFDPKTGKQRQIWCLAISAKRYALFLKDKNGNPVLLRKGLNNGDDRWSKHGLGHLLNPTDPECEDREWIAQVWLGIIRRTLGLRTRRLPLENLPAVGRVTVSSPAVMRPFAAFNRGKPYSEQVKPFNFLLTAFVTPGGRPLGVDPEHFHLIRKYDLDPRQWLQGEWIDQYSGETYRVTTDPADARQNVARVKTYGDVILEYEFHPESKCADAEESPSDQQTIGRLQRRRVHISFIKCIGKESNNLEDVEAEMVHDPNKIYTEYPDPSRDEWQMVILPKLRKLPLPVLMYESGLSRRALQIIRAGRRPNRANLELLTAVVRKLESKESA